MQFMNNSEPNQKWTKLPMPMLCWYIKQSKMEIASQGSQAAQLGGGFHPRLGINTCMHTAEGLKSCLGQKRILNFTPSLNKQTETMIYKFVYG